MVVVCVAHLVYYCSRIMWVRDCAASCVCLLFFFQAEDGIRDLVRSRGLGDVYKRQVLRPPQQGDHQIGQYGRDHDRGHGDQAKRPVLELSLIHI